MHNKLAKLKRTVTFLAGISAVSIPAIAWADWSIRELGALDGSYSVAKAINDSGQVAGVDNSAGFSRAFITGANGVGINYLDTLGGVGTYAADINISGQVVGYSFTSAGSTHAFITGANGVGMTDLGTLGGDYSIAYGVNDFGQVVGVSSTAGNAAYHAFITGPGGVGMTDLTALRRISSVAYDINNSGQVVGSFSNARNTMQHAFITGENGIGIKDLGSIQGATHSFAGGINDAGQVVGFSGFYDPLSGYLPGHAFITDADGLSLADLGVPIDSIANDINDFGQVVGGLNSFCIQCTHSAFLYADDLITDLSLLAPVVAAGWTELSAVGINNHGQIIGWGSLKDSAGGGSRAFLLSPDSPIVAIPEPETYAMLLAGLGLLGFVLRRRKQTR